MCGTLKLSRVTTRSGRAGIDSTPIELRLPNPKTFCLKKFGRSAAVTLAFRGVSPSYRAIWSVE
jgi:hypothetical protein